MSENKTAADQDNRFLVIPILVALGAGYQNYKPVAWAYYYKYHFKIWFCVWVTVIVALLILAMWLWNKYAAYANEREIISQDNDSVELGKCENGRTVHLKQIFRTTHTQVIGTTSAGKTESVILPWAIRDLETGAGLLIIDGKSDSSFLEKFYAYVVKSGRQKDFRLFSLAQIQKSSSFNPLLGGSPQEVVERVFSSFPFENEYYRNIQYKIFLKMMLLVKQVGKVPTMHLIQRLLTDMSFLKYVLQNCADPALKRELTAFCDEAESTRLEKVSGLDAYLSHYASGDLATIFNQEESDIQFDEVLRHNRVCYFQLPSLYFPFLAEATGKLVLQAFSSAVAKRHLGLSEKNGFFSVFLDDFQDYIYEGFGALLNKSRSANVGVVFSHQALGDLEKVSTAFQNVVLTNTNIKVVMRNNNPDTCEYFAKSFGTKKSVKVTERQEKILLRDKKTGHGTVREVDEYTYHPNIIKQLGVGQGIVSIPHFNGVKLQKIKFQRRPDIHPVALPEIKHQPLIIEHIPEELKTVSPVNQVI